MYRPPASPLPPPPRGGEVCTQAISKLDNFAARRSVLITHDKDSKKTFIDSF